MYIHCIHLLKKIVCIFLDLKACVLHCLLSKRIFHTVHIMQTVLLTATPPKVFLSFPSLSITFFAFMSVSKKITRRGRRCHLHTIIQAVTPAEEIILSVILKLPT